MVLSRVTDLLTNSSLAGMSRHMIRIRKRYTTLDSAGTGPPILSVQQAASLFGKMRGLPRFRWRGIEGSKESRES